MTLFYDLLQIGEVYEISKGAIKAANKTYSTIDNDYEMTLDSTSTIMKCEGAVDVPQIKYNTVPISDLINLLPTSSTDVLAIVKEVGPLAELMSKAQKLVLYELTI